MSVELLHGDCMEYMAGLADGAFDLAIVDPPYRDSNAFTQDMRKNDNRFAANGELGTKPDQRYFDELIRVSKEQIIWGANNFGLVFKGFAIYKKSNIPEDFSMSMCEIASLSEGLSTIAKLVELRSSGQVRIHPTQKPVALYRWLLHNYAKPGWRILDTHLGSGSSAIAAHEMGFDFVGLEIDADYIAAARKRFDLMTIQQRLAI